MPYGCSLSLVIHSTYRISRTPFYSASIQANGRNDEYVGLTCMRAMVLSLELVPPSLSRVLLGLYVQPQESGTRQEEIGSTFISNPIATIKLALWNTINRLRAQNDSCERQSRDESKFSDMPLLQAWGTRGFRKFWLQKPGRLL